MSYLPTQDGRAYIKPYVYVSYNVRWGGYFPTDPYYRFDYFNDTLLLDGPDDAPGIFFPWYVGLSDLTGHDRNNRQSGELNPGSAFLTYKPEQLKYDGDADWRSYGGVGQTLFHGNFSRLKNENQVAHTAYKGDVQDAIPANDETMPFLLDGVWYPNDIIPLPRRLRSGSGNVYRTDGYNPTGWRSFSVSHTSALNAGPTYDIHDAVQRYASAGSIDIGSWGYPGGNRYHRIWSNFDVEAGFHSSPRPQYHFRCAYDYEQTWQDFSWFARVKFRVVRQFLLTIRGDYFPNDPVDVSGFPMEAFELKNSSSVTPLNWSSPAGSATPLVLQLPELSMTNAGSHSSVVQVGDLSGSNPFKSFRAMEVGGTAVQRRNRHLERWMENNIRELRPAAYLAASDAVDRYWHLWDTNVLQLLQKVGDILNILPDPKPLLALYFKIVKGDLSVLKDFVDLLTGTLLQYKFVQAPLYRTITDLLGLDPVAWLRRLSYHGDLEMRGSFRYAFLPAENTVGDGDLALEVHIKMFASIDLSTALTAILAADGIGILPTLSRIWEILPFSFVVDWFTNMKARIHAGENQAKMLCFRCDGIVVSYKIKYTPSADELQDYGLASPDGSFSIVAYKREKSSLMPLLRESKFDLLRNQGGVNLATAGSLLWQQLS